MKGLKKLSHSGKKEIIRKYIKKVNILYEPICGFLIDIHYMFGHSVYHIINHKYTMGLDLDGLDSFAFDVSLDNQKIADEMLENIKIYNAIDDLVNPDDDDDNKELVLSD